MPTPRKHPHKNEWPSTYLVQAKRRKGKQEEIARIEIEDRLSNTTMKGPLAEQPDPTIFHQALDVACGAGGWVIEAALAYPQMRLMGVDINHAMVEMACAQAKARQLTDRVSFRVMDALAPFEFPNESFDLVNMRLASTFLRTWDWPGLLLELLRILRPGGIIRVTEPEMVRDTNSQALIYCGEQMECALYRAGHHYEEDYKGITTHLPRLLSNHGWKGVQAITYAIVYQSDTPEKQAYYENFSRLRSLRPFLEKWGCCPDDLEKAYNQALDDMKRSDFYAVQKLVTVWGIKPGSLDCASSGSTSGAA